jgi:hypothetical protein
MRSSLIVRSVIHNNDVRDMLTDTADYLGDPFLFVICRDETAERPLHDAVPFSRSPRSAGMRVKDRITQRVVPMAATWPMVASPLYEEKPMDPTPATVVRPATSTALPI